MTNCVRRRARRLKYLATFSNRGHLFEVGADPRVRKCPVIKSLFSFLLFPGVPSPQQRPLHQRGGIFLHPTRNFPPNRDAIARLLGRFRTSATPLDASPPHHLLSIPTSEFFHTNLSCMAKCSKFFNKVTSVLRTISHASMCLWSC